MAGKKGYMTPVIAKEHLVKLWEKEGELTCPIGASLSPRPPQIIQGTRYNYGKHNNRKTSGHASWQHFISRGSSSKLFYFVKCTTNMQQQSFMALRFQCLLKYQVFTTK